MVKVIYNIGNNDYLFCYINVKLLFMCGKVIKLINLVEFWYSYMSMYIDFDKYDIVNGGLEIDFVVIGFFFIFVIML